ncbi:MAG: hypothetical protein QXY52_06900 [Conexivisphaerales archaeon]
MKAAVESVKFLIMQSYRDSPSKLSEMQAALADRITMKFRIKRPYELKLLFCKKCKAYSPPIYSKTIRVRKGKLIFTCKKCGSVYRVKFK